MTNCSHCGTVNVDDSKYCKACGTRLIASSYTQCRQCQSMNLADSAYCNRCGERLVPTAGIPPSEKIAREHAEESLSETFDDDAADLPVFDQPLSRAHANSAKGLIPTHELLQMANALNIDVDYNTLRFWQKRGLVPDPKRGPVESGRGTRGYYDASLIDRLGFIREIQKTYAMGLETIGAELEQIDQHIAKRNDPAACYRARLDELRAQREMETKRTLLAVLGKALGIPPNEIAIVVVRKKDGDTVRFVAERAPGERAPTASAPPPPLRTETRETLEKVRNKLEKLD
ncbi:MAG: zinc ribbon domain-containing protein [Chloroflexi bacterium]|nr:zinc ribbon domain-containing protein [Chloroflexota bacterium]